MTNDPMQKIIFGVLAEHDCKQKRLVACQVANALIRAGYGPMGLGGPSQLFAFEVPIHPPVEDDCSPLHLPDKKLPHKKPRTNDRNSPLNLLLR